MRVPSFLNCIVIFFALTVPTLLQAQLSESDRNNAVRTIAKYVAENYVDQDMGGKIASHLLVENHNGAFNKAAGWQEFNTLVTNSMQKFSHDHHLYVRHNPEIVKELKIPESAKDQMSTGDENITENNSGISEAKVLDNNIGYLKLTSITINKGTLPRLYEAMRKFENTSALIIDLRDNGGGGSEIGSVLESYFLPANTALLEFRSRQGTQTIDSTVSWLEEKRYHKPVYVLANKKTASAAEAFAFVMKENKRAKIIGETTAGAANRNDWYIVNDENFVSVSTASTYLPGTQISWEGVGVKPDIKVKNGDALQYTLDNVVKK